MNSSCNYHFKKNIWLFWHQGWENAPELIKICKDSWIDNNPDWNINLLDKNSINSFIDLDLNRSEFQNLCIAHKSDLIRLGLLEKYGGVWADASLFCLIPLNKWLFKYLKSGIFLFHSNTKLTVAANWFIAAESNHKTIIRVNEMLNYFWIKNKFPKLNIFSKSIRKIISPILNINKTTSRIWLNAIFTKFLKIYPYQIFYFLFEIITSKEFEHYKCWEKTPKLNKYICWPYQEPTSPPSEKLISRLKDEFVPMLKLNWRELNEKDISRNSLIYFLKNSFSRNF